MWRPCVGRVSRFVAASAIASVLVSAGSAEAGGNGYVTAGAGWHASEHGPESLHQFSGGGEGLVDSHVGLGGDGSLVVGRGGDVIAATFNATIHIREQNRAIRMDPFVRGGCTLLTDLTGGASALNIGGGFNYWFREHRAWVAEIRGSTAVASGGHIWVASVGMAFR